MLIKNLNFEILTDNGWKDFKGITNNGFQKTYKLTTNSNNSISATNEHYFFQNKIKIQLKQLVVGDLIDTVNGADEIISIEFDKEEVVYDLFEVDDEYHSFIANAHFITKNCDEYAFVDNALAEEFFTAVYPTVTAGKDTKVFITSTPNGYNHFHKMWHEAELNINGFVAIECFWYETPGRDQKWFDEQRAVLGELKTAQEILACFQGSSRTLLNGTALSKLTYDLPLKEYADQFKGLKLYKMPEKHKVYSMSVDVSRGRHLDYSAFTIFDITQYPHTIVATYRNNEISPMLYATILQKIGINYNNSYMLIEINDIGGQVADILWNECEYENLHWTKSGELLGKAGSDPYPGIRTTRKTKRIGCANLKDMVENDQLIINDFDMISELSTFVQKDGGSYEADTGFHDDTVATLWLHAWMITQPWFSELTDTNLRLKMHSNHIAQMESEICMPILYTDGLEEYDDYSLRYEWSNGY